MRDFRTKLYGIGVIVMMIAASIGTAEAHDTTALALGRIEAKLDAVLSRLPEPSQGMGIQDIGTSWTYKVNGVSSTATLTGYRQRWGQDLLEITFDKTLQAEGACNGRDGDLWDAKTNSWTACMKDGKVLAEDIPHDGRHRPPFTVGKTWTHASFWEDYVKPEESGGPAVKDWEVTAYEVVTVEAGAFAAFRIEIVGANFEYSPQTFWWAPSIRSVVKADYDGTIAELVDYDLVSNETGATQ